MKIPRNATLQKRISKWGKGDKLTLKVLNTIQSKGTWLNLAAGDGRYIPELLKKVDKLIASDIDKKGLFNLSKSVPRGGKKKVKIKLFDITKTFPFKNKSFDGILCTGTLHLFSKEMLKFVFDEIDRILKPKGNIIIDFATDIKRTCPDGKVIKLQKTPRYRISDVRRFLKMLLRNYKVKIYKSKFADDLSRNPKYGFITKGNFVLLMAEKKASRNL